MTLNELPLQEEETSEELKVEPKETPQTLKELKEAEKDYEERNTDIDLDIKTNAQELTKLQKEWDGWMEDVRTRGNDICESANATIKIYKSNEKNYERKIKNLQSKIENIKKIVGNKMMMKEPHTHNLQLLTAQLAQLKQDVKNKSEAGFLVIPHKERIKVDLEKLNNSIKEERETAEKL